MSNDLSISQINKGGSVISNPGDIADMFNEYFSSNYQAASNDFPLRMGLGLRDSVSPPADSAWADPGGGQGG